MQDYAVKLYERVRAYIEKTGLSQGGIAQVMGLPVRKFNYYLTEKSQVNLWPLLPRLLQNDKKLSREWLYFGEGPMFCEACDAPHNPAESIHSAAPHGCDSMQSQQFPALGELLPATAASPIRLTGLTECGLHGWFNRAYRSVNVSPPRCGEHWVVVQAMGDSMVPHGIMEGYTLFCDPSQPPATGEAVYALRRDGYATVKLYQGRDAQGRIVLQGWQTGPSVGNTRTAGEQGLAVGTETGRRGGMPCGPSASMADNPFRVGAGAGAGAGSGMEVGAGSVAQAGAQEAYYLYCGPADIALLAPVIYIKCRL